MPEQFPMHASFLLLPHQMLDRLDQSFKQIRQFTADASHELRTPVSILMGETELAVNNLLDYEECKAAIASRREELQRMARIIDDLLALSQFDFRERTLQSKPPGFYRPSDRGLRAARNQARDPRGFNASYLRSLLPRG